MSGSALPLFVASLLFLGGLAGTSAAQGTPARGGTLVVALFSDPGHLNPAITTSGPTHAAAETLFNGLVGRGERGELLPELAESWAVEEGGLRYRFRLRDSVRWHDGRPLTAADVKFTFEELLLKFHARTKASMAPALAGIQAPDDRTVVFRFKHPYAPLLQQLDVTEAPILPKHVFQEDDPHTHPANSRPIGTGPFRLASYQKGAELRFARNPAYFRKDLPYLDALVMRIIPDPSTQVLALEQGEVDFVWDVPGPDQARLVRDPRFRTVRSSYNTGGSNCVMTLAFNLDRPSLQDVRVRQAVARAIDPQPFVTQVLYGAGRPARAPISSGIPWAHAEESGMPGHDRAEAARLLQDVGWRAAPEGPRAARGVAGVAEGARLSLELLLFPRFLKYGEVLRQQLGGVGIDLRPRPVEPAVLAPTVFKDRNFDTTLISYCQGPDPEVGVRRMYHSSQIGPAPFTNAAGYRSSRVDALFDAAARAVERGARGRLYREAQALIAADLPYVGIVETLETRAWAARCADFQPWTGLLAEAAWCAR